MMQIPVWASPASSARGMGAAPRHRGSREAWMLRHPRGGIESNAGGKRSPYAATTITSAPHALTVSRASSPFKESGLYVGRPRCAAASETALEDRCRPRPAGRSGRVMTRAMSLPASRRASSARAAKGGVPAKTTRKDARPNSGGLALALLQLRPDTVLLQFRKIVDED